MLLCDSDREPQYFCMIAFRSYVAQGFCIALPVLKAIM
jgi:hypothetical protein